MPITQGLQVIGNYAGAGTDGGAVDVLLALIPNPDLGAGSDGAKAGANSSYLDEMMPMCAAQLRVELAAMRVAINVTPAL